LLAYDAGHNRVIAHSLLLHLRDASPHGIRELAMQHGATANGVPATSTAAGQALSDTEDIFREVVRDVLSEQGRDRQKKDGG
jgi:hypothetical protein